MPEYKKLISEENTEYGSSSTEYGSSSKDSYEPPKDKYNLAYISFFIIGIGLLLPWNFFINADQYFKEKLSNNEEDKKLFESAFSICSQVPCGIALILNLYLTDRVSRKGRVLSTLFISALCFILTTALVNIDTESWTGSFFGITLATIVIINFCAGIFQGTMFGIAGAMGGRYVQSTVIGLTVAGTFTSIANLISLAAGDDIKASATIYFIIAIFVTVACFVIFILMFRLPLIKERFEECEGMNSAPNSLESPSHNIPDTTKYKAFAVLKIIYPIALSVMFIYTVSLSVMPSILSGLRSMNADNGSPWTNKYFTGIVGFLIFNLGDFSGRVIAGFVKIVGKKGPWLTILCLARVVFIPLFMLCNYQPRQHLSVVFKSDAFPVIFNILFSVSNGYFTSICMVYGTDLVPNEMKETAGNTMQLFLTLGLGLGSALSFLVVEII